MSLSSAMNVGVSGLGINAEAISVVGNNIANVNTVGFKEGRTIFSDMLSANIGAGQVGRGGQIQTIQNMFSQGSFENTSADNDLAIQGESFFVLQDSLGTQSFTRAGAFDYNKNQVLVNPNGMEVMGYGITQATGLSNGILGNIDKTAFATLAPKTTTEASFVMNLDSTVNAPNSSITNSVRVDGDFGHAGALTTSIALAGGGTPGVVGNIIDATGASLPYTITPSPMVVEAAAAPVMMVVNAVGTPTQIGTYSSTAGGVITFTPTAGAVAVDLDGAGTTQNITFTDSLSGTTVAGATTATPTPGLTLPSPTTITFYDEFGSAQSANITWGGASPNVTYAIHIDNATAGTPGSTGFEITGTLNFPTPTTSTINTTVTLNNGAKPMPVTFDLSNMTNSTSATAPSITANGAPIKTANIALTGGTTGTTTASVIITGGGAASATDLTVTDSLGLTHTLNFVFTDDGSGLAGTIVPTVDGVAEASIGTYTSTAAGASITGVTIPGGAMTVGSSRVVIDATGLISTIPVSPVATASTLTPLLGSTGTLVDSSGVSHTVTISFPTATTWQADIAGATPATATITGSFASAVNGKSTWDQSSATVNIGGITQPVSFDLSNVTTGAAVTDVRSNGWDQTNPAVTANFSNSTQLYDSQGNAHTATVYYSKTGANAWDYHLSIPDATSINGMAGNKLLNGSLAFNTAGILISQVPSNVNGLAVQFPGSVASQNITLDFNPNASTQLASSSVLSYQTQNGYGAGNLISTKIDDQGYVNASYTNNQAQRIALVALARFASVAGLEKIGNSLFTSTEKSGFAIVGTAELQGSKIFTKSLEQSNVDMATQLVNMIKLQRAYSGNSKTITSSDEMMQETLGLKR